MKILRTLGIGLLAVIPFLTMKAQKSMTPYDLEAWKRITTRSISNDGQWAAAIFSPWRGDSEVQVLAVDGKSVQTYVPASEVNFSSSSVYALVKKVPAVTLTDSLKLKKTKKDKMPMDELVVRHLKTGTEWVVDSLKNYRLAEEGEWMAYQRTRKDSSLVVSSLDGVSKYVLPSASVYGFAKEKAALYFVTKEDKNGQKPGLYVWTAETPQPVLVKEGKGLFLQPTFNKAGNKLAFLYTDNKKEKDYITKWGEEYGYDIPIITAAFDMLPAGSQMSFGYIDKILADWHENNCNTVDECEERHRIYLKERETAENKSASSSTARRAPKKTTPRYGDFDPDEAFRRALARTYGESGSGDKK